MTKHTQEQIDAAIELCEMVGEIGVSDDAIIPMWPVDSEMALISPLYASTFKLFLAALKVYKQNQWQPYTEPDAPKEMNDES